MAHLLRPQLGDNISHFSLSQAPLIVRNWYETLAQKRQILEVMGGGIFYQIKTDDGVMYVHNESLYSGGEARLYSTLYVDNTGQQYNCLLRVNIVPISHYNLEDIVSISRHLNQGRFPATEHIVPHIHEIGYVSITRDGQEKFQECVFQVIDRYDISAYDLIDKPGLARKYFITPEGLPHAQNIKVIINNVLEALYKLALETRTHGDIKLSNTLLNLDGANDSIRSAAITDFIPEQQLGRKGTFDLMDLFSLEHLQYRSSDPYRYNPYRDLYALTLMLTDLLFWFTTESFTQDAGLFRHYYVSKLAFLANRFDNFLTINEPFNLVTSDLEPKLIAKKIQGALLRIENAETKQTLDISANLLEQFNLFFRDKASLDDRSTERVKLELGRYLHSMYQMRGVPDSLLNLLPYPGLSTSQKRAIGEFLSTWLGKSKGFGEGLSPRMSTAIIHEYEKGFNNLMKILSTIPES